MGGGSPPGGPNSDFRLEPLAFSDLSGWADDDHAAALAAFQRGADVLGEHPPKSRTTGVDAEALARLIARSATIAPAAARAFFEDHFRAFAVVPATGAAFFTGFYEPEVTGSRVRTPGFTVPLYLPPPDLVEIAPGSAPGLDPSFRFARQTASGLAELPDRAAIAGGALAGRGLELVWLADPVDAFFIHVQGAARIRLPDGSLLRVTYVAKSGHPYTAIGRVLIDVGALAPGTATMQTIRAWLAAHPDRAGEVMAANRSYIFFREASVADPALGPVAAAKVPLTAGRSLAVDRLIHTFHAPVWVETTLADGEGFRRLLVAQDTGSAIVGPARGDIFFGSGDAAGMVAGAMRAGGRFVLLMPRGAP
jgi:membrane-bound lytic murein transglycosylase A